MDAPLAPDLALRIGLAARALAGTDPAILLRLLIRIIGEPITHAKLAKLRAGRLRGAASLNKVDAVSFSIAFDILRGSTDMDLPEPQLHPAAGSHGYVQVACASDSAEYLDGSFTRCRRFLIYQVSADDQRLVAVRDTAALPKGRGAPQARADLIRDCVVLYTTDIGAAAAAKLVKVGAYPLVVEPGQSAHDTLRRLQSVLAREALPPWLAKAMGREVYPPSAHTQTRLEESAG